jgi:hypothetical protein
VFALLPVLLLLLLLASNWALPLGSQSLSAWPLPSLWL